MLKTYQLQNGGLKGTPVTEGEAIPDDQPVARPDRSRRSKSGAPSTNSCTWSLPTRADMEEIEISSRLYQEDGGLFMTATVLSNTDTERPAPTW